MSRTQRPARRKHRRRRLGIVLLVIASLAGSGYGYYRSQYPLGWSHSCDKQLSLGLWLYAEAHDGQFPAGETTPEASLSLLHRYSSDFGARLLSGKTVATSVAEDVLARGELLDPDTCDWHYVPGLNVNDDSRLALFWDKPGLGHNGERLPGGGHIVWFVSGDRRHVTTAEWDDFLAEQEELLRKRRK